VHNQKILIEVLVKHKRQVNVLSDHIVGWLYLVIIDAICSILLSLQIRSLLLSSMSCSSVQQLRFVKLYDLFCVRLFRARLDPREPLHGTIPSQIACVIDITFDYVERFLGGFLRRQTGPQLAHIFNKK